MCGVGGVCVFGVPLWCLVVIMSLVIDDLRGTAADRAPFPSCSSECVSRFDVYTVILTFLRNLFFAVALISASAFPNGFWIFATCLIKFLINASGSMHPLTFGNVSQNRVWWGVG